MPFIRVDGVAIDGGKDFELRTVARRPGHRRPVLDTTRRTSRDLIRRGVRIVHSDGFPADPRHHAARSRIKTGLLSGSALGAVQGPSAGYAELRDCLKERADEFGPAGSSRTRSSRAAAWRRRFARRATACAQRELRAGGRGKYRTRLTGTPLQPRVVAARASWDHEASNRICSSTNRLARMAHSAAAVSCSSSPRLLSGWTTRLVGTALVLLDTHAEIVIDVLPDAAVR